jgi:peroxiredoxin
VSIDSPAANAAFAKQIGVEFPLLSDMNKKMLTSYGILKGYDKENQTYEWAQRANIVIDKNGVIPNNALTMCTKLHNDKPGATK